MKDNTRYIKFFFSRLSINFFLYSNNFVMYFYFSKNALPAFVLRFVFHIPLSVSLKIRKILSEKSYYQLLYDLSHVRVIPD